MGNEYVLDDSTMLDIISQVSTIHELVKAVAPEDIHSRNVSTKWAELFNEIQELEDRLDEIKNPVVEEPTEDMFDEDVENWIEESTPIPEFNE